MLEVQSGPYDRSSQLSSSLEMFHFDVNPGLRVYLHPLLATARELRAAFRSISSIQVDSHGETLRQSASSIISSLYQRLSFSPAGHQYQTATYSLRFYRNVIGEFSLLYELFFHPIPFSTLCLLSFFTFFASFICLY